MKKIYIGTFVIILLLASAAGYYKFQKKLTIKPVFHPSATQPITETDELSQEQESFNKDAADIEKMDQDNSLAGLDQDLALISGEQTPSDNVSLNALENELNSEISAFSSDSKELDGISNDMSLSSLDTELNTIK